MKTIVREVKTDIRSARKFHLPGSVFAGLIIVGAPIAFLFDHFGKLAYYLPIFNTIFAFGLAIYVKQRFWGRAWFWLTLAGIAALNGVVLFFVPWDDRWHPATMWAGISTIEFILIVFLLDLVERFAEGKRRGISHRRHQ